MFTDKTMIRNLISIFSIALYFGFAFYTNVPSWLVILTSVALFVLSNWIVSLYEEKDRDAVNYRHICDRLAYAERDNTIQRQLYNDLEQRYNDAIRNVQSSPILHFKCNQLTEENLRLYKENQKLRSLFEQLHEIADKHQEDTAIVMRLQLEYYALG